MLMTSKGQSVRIRVSEIRETGRNAQGAPTMNEAKANSSRTWPPWSVIGRARALLPGEGGHVAQ